MNLPTLVITMAVLVWHEIYWLIAADLSRLLGVTEGILNIYILYRSDPKMTVLAHFADY